MNVVRRDELDEEGGQNVSEENEALWNSRAHEIESSGEDYDIDDVIDEA